MIQTNTIPQNYFSLFKDMSDRTKIEIINWLYNSLPEKKKTIEILENIKKNSIDRNDTDYLLSSKTNANRLFESIEQMDNGKSFKKNLIEV